MLSAAADGGNSVLVLCAVASVILSVLLALNSLMKDRQKKTERERKADDEKDAVTETEYVELKSQFERLSTALMGNGLPGSEGFIQRQERHNEHVDRELTDANGGGTLRGAVQGLRREVQSVTREVRRGNGG